MRNGSIDVGRGLLVVMMVYCHVLQFFGSPAIFPVEYDLMNVINLSVFPTFTFFFGMTCAYAYLNKTYRQALPRLIKTCLRIYVVFVISGVGYRVLRENGQFNTETAKKVLLLLDIPGWSEFLISFSAYALMLMVLFPFFKWIKDRLQMYLLVSLACLGFCFIDYDSVLLPHVSLLIGGTGFAYFPAVQYMPYFLAGIICADADQKTKRFLAAIAGIASGIGIVYWIKEGMPSRFPPHYAWILLSAGNTALIALLGNTLDRLRKSNGHRGFRILVMALENMGARSLYLLLASNLVIFTLSGSAAIPEVAGIAGLSAHGSIASPGGAFLWTVCLLGMLMFVAGLAERGESAKAKRRE